MLETNLSTFIGLSHNEFKGSKFNRDRAQQIGSLLCYYIKGCASKRAAYDISYLFRTVESSYSEYTFQVNDISINELKSAFESCNKSSADEISFKFLRKFSHSALQVIFSIINDFFNTSSCPKEWNDCKTIAKQRQISSFFVSASIFLFAKQRLIVSSYRLVCLAKGKVKKKSLTPFLNGFRTDFGIHRYAFQC